MCHLADPPETPPPELGATALPTLHAAVLGWHTTRSATTRTVIHKTFEINTRFHGLVNQEDCLGTLPEEGKITELWRPRADADDDDEAMPTGHG